MSVPKLVAAVAATSVAVVWAADWWSRRLLARLAARFLTVDPQ